MAGETVASIRPLGIRLSVAVAIANMFLFAIYLHDLRAIVAMNLWLLLQAAPLFAFAGLAHLVARAARPVAVITAVNLSAILLSLFVLGQSLSAFWFRYVKPDPSSYEPNATWLLSPIRTSLVVGLSLLVILATWFLSSILSRNERPAI